MAADVATLTLRADISELQRKLKSIPDDADGQAKRMAVSLERAFKRAEKAATDASRNSAKAQAQAAKDAERAAADANRRMGEGLKGLGELAGLPVDKIEKLGQAFGLAGGTFGAIAGGAALATLALTGAAAAVYAIVDSAIELEKELKPLRDKGLLPPLDPDWTSNLNEAEQSMVGAKIAAQGLVVQVGGELAPAIEYAAVTASKLVSVISASGETFTAFGQLLKNGAIIYLQAIADLGLAIPSIFASMAGVVGAALSAAGLDTVGGRLTKLADGFNEFKDSLGETVVTGVLDNYTTGLALMGREAQVDGEAIRELGAASLELGDKQEAAAKKSAAASKAQAGADKERAAALAKVRSIAEQTEAASASAERKLGMAASKKIEELNAIMAQYSDQPDIVREAVAAEEAVRIELQQQLGELQQKQQAEYDAARAESIKREADARIAAEQKVHDRRMALADSFFTASIAFTSGVSDLLEVTAKANAKRDRELALRQFNASKAAGIAEATINGAVAITRALASLGPVAGAIAATGIGASTAAQIAVIASQKPAFDRGGMIQGGQMSDQVPINALPGEAVLSRGAVRAIGGQAGVDRLNRGGAQGGQNVVVINAYKHFGRFVQDELQRSSVLQSAMIGARTIGVTGY